MKLREKAKLCDELIILLNDENKEYGETISDCLILIDSKMTDN